MRTSTGKGVSAISFAVCVLCFLLIGLLWIQPSLERSSVFADPAYEFQPGFGTATIDGYIDEEEWASADSHTLQMTNTTMEGTLYVMEDGTNLYLGFEIDDDEFTLGSLNGVYGDTLIFDFDDNNSGSLFEIGENKIVIFAANPWYLDGYFYNTDPGSSRSDIDAEPSGQTNGSASSARQGSYNHFELSFPLCSGDDYDFCLSSGEILGLRIKYFDMYPDGDGVAYSVHFYPGSSLTSLVTIEITSTNTFLPLIVE